jgi:hypothetical protein
MKLKDYQKIYDAINSREDVYEFAIKEMNHGSSISYNTLLAIYSQKHQEFTRKTYHKHHKKDIMMAYFNRQEHEQCYRKQDTMML